MIPLPPTDLREGTKLICGMGFSTVIADLDFETYSESGYIWCEYSQKYKAPPNASKKGLPTIGAARYSEHPSTEVLSCAYDLKDGKGKRLWKPGDPDPLDLFNHIKDGKLIEAWNVSFERWIWTNVCQKLYNWPPVSMNQWRDAAAKSVAHALPKSLGPAGIVMDIKHKKDKDGLRLLTKFSMPRNPTKSDTRRRILLSEDPKDAQNLYNYNLRDIEAEAELSGLIPDLNSFELEFWQCDQNINFRGVMVDLSIINASISIIEQAYKKYNSRIKEITNGHVSKASEIAKIRSWLASQSVYVEVLDSEELSKLLKKDLPINVREVLTIRERIGSASVKKLYAMTNTVTKSGRIHDLFIYHSARTGRAAGSGVQPQNFPNSGPSVFICSSCNTYSDIELCCPYCSKHRQHTNKIEWNKNAVEDAFKSIATGNLDCVEYHWNDAFSVISSCLRGLFISAPGKDFICSDYSAIEAVVLAEISGESWRQEVFRTHGKIYEMSASKITGIPFDDYIKHKQETGQHHPTRKTIGKVAELACFTRDTQVLTNRGYVRIMDVRKDDLLWDGLEWVKHQGVIHRGKKKVIKLDGVKMTPEHPISIDGFWKEAKQLASNKNILIRALETGSENLPFLAKQSDKKLELNALVQKIFILLNYLICVKGKVLDAIPVLRKNQIKHTLNYIRNMLIYSPIPNIEEGLSIDYALRSHDAPQSNINNMQIMGDGVLKYAPSGEKMRDVFLRMLSPLKDGIIQNWRWIGLIAIKATNPGIFALLQSPKMLSIKEAFKKCKQKLSFSRPVYDIVNAGSRHRFTIKTNSGHLLVHNSGYGGWIGAWKAFGADEFLSEEEIKQSILSWRKASPAIVELWGGQVRGWFPDYFGLEGAAVQAVLYPGIIFEYRGFKWIVKQDVLYCELLSGRYLTYHKPRLTHSERKKDTWSLSYEGWNSNPQYGAPGWIRIETYGGKLAENITQATARDILAHAIVNLENAGYPVILHVHDEIVCEVPENFGSIEEFEKIMSAMPSWAKGWPVRASGGWRAKRYGK